MNGDHDRMCSAVSLDVWGTDAGGHHDVLYGMLTNQFVTTPLHPGRSWEVVSGAGMGFPCAGDVADVYFSVLVESKVFREFRNSGLLFYGRYRDDMIFMCTDRYDWVRTMAFLRRCSAGQYKIEMSSMGTQSCVFWM